MDKKQKILIALIILILVGISGWIIYSNNESIKESVITPTGNIYISNEVNL